MAKRGGYIKLFRAIAGSSMWTKEPFTRGQAWVDLLLLANYAPGHLRVRGNRIEIARGQVGWSAERLAKRWTWSRKKVARFLNELEKDQQIAQHKSFVSSLFTITNYERYQRKVSAERPAQAQQKPSSGTAEGTAEDTAEGALKKKKVKKKERNSSASEFVAPTLDQVAAYCQTRRNGIDPEEFIAHYYDPPSLPFPETMTYDDPGEPVFAPQPSPAVLVAALGLWLAIIAVVAGGLYWMGVGA